MCSSRADIAFALDTSGSVDWGEFFLAKEFIKAVVVGVNPGAERVRIGMIRFATDAELIFPFNKYYRWWDLVHAIANMEDSSGGTRTDKAFRLARTELFTEKGGSRPNVPKLLVLLTDGHPNFRERAVREAYLLKKSGVYVVVLAIGKDINTEEPRKLASRPDDVIVARRYADLRRLIEQTRKRLCEGKF